MGVGADNDLFFLKTPEFPLKGRSRLFVVILDAAKIRLFRENAESRNYAVCLSVDVGGLANSSEFFRKFRRLFYRKGRGV